jgi:hypothetical protein
MRTYRFLSPDAPAGGTTAPAGGTPAPTPPAGGGQQTVAWDTYQQTVSAKNALEAKVADLTSQVTKLSEKAATVDTLSSQVNEWKAKAEKAEGRFATFTEFSGALGIQDTEVIDAFEQHYQKLPEKDRPSRKDHVANLRAKRDEAPVLLRGFLGDATPAQGGAKPPPKPKVPGTPATPPGSPAKPSEDAIRAAKDKGVRTGDWSDWRELRKQFGGKAPAQGS